MQTCLKSARGELNPGSKKRARKLNGKQKREGWWVLRRLPWGLNWFGSAILMTPLKAKFWAFGPCIWPLPPSCFPRRRDSCVSPSPSQYYNLVFLSSRTTSPLLLPCYRGEWGSSQLLQLSMFVPAIYSFISAWKPQFRRL